MNLMIQDRSNLGKSRYHHSEVVTDATSAPLFLPNNGQEALVLVKPGTDALVQYTISQAAKVTAGTANWVDWPDGLVTTQRTDAIAGAVTALRLVSTGASTWEVAK